MLMGQTTPCSRDTQEKFHSLSRLPVTRVQTHTLLVLSAPTGAGDVRVGPIGFEYNHSGDSDYRGKVDTRKKVLSVKSTLKLRMIISEPVPVSSFLWTTPSLTSPKGPGVPVTNV